MSNTLPGTVQTAAPNLKGFDTDTAISSSSVAQQFKAEGYSFCVRYLSLTTPEQTGDLSCSEANYILIGGLALSAVQHPTSLTLTEELGTQHGANAAANAASIGLPQGMVLWCDLEAVDGNIPDSSITISYCQAWFDAVESAGYVPGIYIGVGTGLSGTQLYDLPFAHYWKSCSSVPTPDPRGYQMVQTCYDPALMVNGYNIDTDLTQDDNEGGAVIWLAPAGV
jgi:hypothetical protein